MKKLVISLIASLILLAGCSSATEVAENDPCYSEDGTYDVTMVSDIGGISDKSFNQSTWEGIQQFCTDNEDITATYIETTDPAQMETNLTLAAGQSEVVIIPGFNAGVAVGNVAPDNPETTFITLDTEPMGADYVPVQLDNVKSYYFSMEQVGYLVGYVAGKTTETDKIAFIGGEANTGVTPFSYGYIYGAHMANPDVTVSIQYAETFTDQTKGQTMADTLYGQGYDVIFACAGGTGLGIINSAINQNIAGNEVWTIGVDADQYDQGVYTTPEGEEASVILTSAMKNVGTAAYDGLEEYYTDTFTSGVEVLGYTEGGVGMPEINPNVDEALIEEAYESLESELANIPNTVETTEAAIQTYSINVEGEIK